MVQVIKFDVGSISAALLPKIRAKMSSLLSKMEGYAKEISPTDTKEYVNSFETSVQFVGNRLIGELRNTSEYASGVETGFQRGPVNWHKGPPRNNSNIIYVGVGANVQQRTLNKFIPEINRELGAR